MRAGSVEAPAVAGRERLESPARHDHAVDLVWAVVDPRSARWRSIPESGDSSTSCGRVDHLDRPTRHFASLERRASRLTLAEAARIIRNEYGATESTLRDHEAVLARMSLTLADRDPIEVSIADLRDVHRPLGRALATHSPEGDVRVRAFWVGRGVTQGLSMHLARHTFATDLEVAMEAYAALARTATGGRNRSSRS